MKLHVKLNVPEDTFNVTFREIVRVTDGGYDKGFEEGKIEGYNEGYAEGYDAGYAEGEASGGSDFPVEEYFAKTVKELTLTGVNKLGAYSIYQQNALETLRLPDATVIDSGAVNTCSNLSTVVMGEGLITIGGAGTSVFSSCPNIQFLEIPSTVKTIGWNAFAGCTGLKTVTFLGTPEMIGSMFSKTIFPATLAILNVPWAEGEVEGAPWGATSALINYDYNKED